MERECLLTYEQLGEDSNSENDLGEVNDSVVKRTDGYLYKAVDYNENGELLAINRYMRRQDSFASSAFGDIHD